MATFPEKVRPLVATVAQVARLQGADLEATVLERAKPSLIETGFDNWDGSTTMYTLMLEVPIPTYALISDTEALEKQIQRRVSRLVRTEVGSNITEVIIGPQLAETERPSEPPPSDPGGEEIPSFWQPGYFRLFITHLAAHKASAHKLKEALARFQVAAFVAHDDIEPTREWQGEIERALRTMDALVAVVAPGLVESRWCDQEIGVAIGRGKLVLPLRAGADPHGFMAKYQALQIQNLDALAVAEKIVEVLIQHSQSTERMTEGLVDRLVSSGSWDASKRSMSLLEKAPRLNVSQVARLVRASDENVDVKHAWGVPERIQALVAQRGER
jgi:hypothetical protein